MPGSTAGTTSASLSGLTDGTEHKFQVRAVIEYETALGGALAGAASDEVSVTPVGVVVSKDRLALAEGGAAGAYTVKLSQAPTHNVTITVSVDGDGTVTADTDDVASGNQTTLTFSPTNYATARTVKVTAAADDDGRDSTATITHTASSTDARYGNLTGIPGLTAAVTDNDTLGITLSTASVTVTEGSTATYEVALASQPSGDVTVTLTRSSGIDPGRGRSASHGGRVGRLPRLAAGHGGVVRRGASRLRLRGRRRVGTAANVPDQRSSVPAMAAVGGRNGVGGPGRGQWRYRESARSPGPGRAGRPVDAYRLGQRPIRSASRRRRRGAGVAGRPRVSADAHGHRLEAGVARRGVVVGGQAASGSGGVVGGPGWSQASCPRSPG